MFMSEVNTSHQQPEDSDVRIGLALKDYIILEAKKPKIHIRLSFCALGLNY
jgi:hypothetical protein